MKGIYPVIILFVLLFPFLAFATNSEANSKELHKSEAHSEEGNFSDHMDEFIMHHIGDDYKWHIIGDVNLYLPVILFNVETKTFDVFSSKQLSEGSHKGYLLSHGNLERPDKASFIDISITKNVLSLIFSAVFLILIFIGVAKAYKRREGKAPKGFQSFIEPIIMFVRDEIARPVIGEKRFEKHTPYLLTLFFFIFFNNLLGLVPIMPGGANLTGNFSITFTLAVLTFLIVNISGNKHYWKHIFWSPGVPIALKLPLALIEFIGIFTKPFALMIRLFANITAGHIIILSILSLTFIFQSFAVGIGTSLFSLFMNLLELLVAALQAYIFTMLTALFIGQAIEEPEHH